jgi:hypothetical protein
VAITVPLERILPDERTEVKAPLAKIAPDAINAPDDKIAVLADWAKLPLAKIAPDASRAVFACVANAAASA